MKQAIITALLAIILGTITASADIVKGRVVDSETKEPLPEAQMTYKQSYGDNGLFTRSFKADSLGCFHVFFYPGLFFFNCLFLCL